MCVRSEECLQYYIKHNNTFYFSLSFIKIVYICLKLCSNVSVKRTDILKNGVVNTFPVQNQTSYPHETYIIVTYY